MIKKISFIIIGILLISSVSALSSGEGTILFGTIFSMTATLIFFLVLSIITKNTPMKVFFMGLAILTLITSIGVGVSIAQEFFSDFSQLIVSYGAFYQMLVYLLIAGGAGLILWLLVVAVKSFYAKKGVIDMDLDK